MARRLDNLKNSRVASLYHDVLQVIVADLDAALAGLTASVENLLNQKAA